MQENNNGVNAYRGGMATIMAMSQMMAASQAAESLRNEPNQALSDLAITMTARRRLAKAGNKNPSKRDLFMMTQQILDERENGR